VKEKYTKKSTQIFHESMDPKDRLRKLGNILKEE